MTRVAPNLSARAIKRWQGVGAINLMEFRKLDEEAPR